MNQSLTISSSPSNQALDDSGALVINQLSSVGVGFTILILVFIISLAVNYLFFKRIASLTDQLLNIVPMTTATVLKAVDDFTQALKKLKDGK